MTNFLKIAVFTVLISATYTGIAHLLPQVTTWPPRTVEVGPDSDLGPLELSQAGEEIYQSACAFCHKPGAKRCPDLSGMGALALERARERQAATGETYTALDYVVEALCRPSAHVTDGFQDIMPNQGETLGPGPLLAVSAFLLDLGGTSEVRGTATAPLERFGCGEAPPADAAPAPVGTPEEAWEAFRCGACHTLDGSPSPLGPPLHDVGARLDSAQLLEALLDPPATAPERDPPYPDVMQPALEGSGFYARMSAADYRAMVAWLAEHTGE